MPRSFELLNVSTEDLKSLNITRLENNFNNFFTDCESLEISDASMTLSYLSHLKVRLQHLRTEQKSRVDSINLNDVELIEKISKLPLSSIYPSNEDAFVEFNSDDKVALYSTVNHFEMVNQNNQEHIEFFVQGKKCLSIFSTPNLIQFIYQLLLQFDQFSPADILQTLKVPAAGELDSIVSAKQEKLKLFNDFHTKSDQLINKIITNLIV